MQYCSVVPHEVAKLPSFRSNPVGTGPFKFQYWKEGVKLAINKNDIQLSVNSANSGEGNEIIKANFSSDNLNISFNSKYLIDIASEVEDSSLKMILKDAVSPVLIEDASDKNSYYVIMPMKI